MDRAGDRFPDRAMAVGTEDIMLHLPHVRANVRLIRATVAISRTNTAERCAPAHEHAGLEMLYLPEAVRLLPRRAVRLAEARLLTNTDKDIV